MIKVINIHKNLISLQDDARLEHKSDLLLTSSIFQNVNILESCRITLALEINNKIRERRLTFYDL